MERPVVLGSCPDGKSASGRRIDVTRCELDTPSRIGHPPGEDEDVHLLEVRLDDPAAAPVLAGLATEYEQRYGPTDAMPDAMIEQFDPPAGAFVVLVQEDRTMAGGGCAG